MPGETVSYLPGMEPVRPGLVESDEEKAVIAAIAQIEEAKPLTGAQIALKSMCIALARNISAGNAKGRAIANEVATLAATLATLEGVDDGPSADDLPPEVRNLLNALSSAPRIDPAPGRDDAPQL